MPNRTEVFDEMNRERGREDDASGGARTRTWWQVMAWKQRSSWEKSGRPMVWWRTRLVP